MFTHHARTTLANVAIAVSFLFGVTTVGLAAPADVCLDNPDETTRGVYMVDHEDWDTLGYVDFRADSKNWMTIGTTRGVVSFYNYASSNVAMFTSLQSMAFKPGGGQWVNLSDRRVKKDIEDFVPGLAQLQRVEPREFEFNGLVEPSLDDGQKHIGVVAQEIREIFPSMVHEDSGIALGDSSALIVDASDLTFVLVNAVKEQAQAIDRLQAKTDLLQSLACVKHPELSDCRNH